MLRNDNPQKRCMRRKKCLILIVAVCVVVIGLFLTLDVWNAARGKSRVEAIQRGLEARAVLLDSLNCFVSDSGPEYLIGRYVDAEGKLQIRLHEDAKAQEPILREALGAYSDVAVFSYIPENYAQLNQRVEAIRMTLEENGFPVRNAFIRERTGNIHIVIADADRQAEAAAWVGEQKEYPFDEIGVDVTVWEKGKNNIVSKEAREVLEDFLQKQGKTAYGSYYCGNYIDVREYKLHVVFLETATDIQKRQLKAALKEYASVTVYETGGYSETETWEYLDALADTLTECGLFVWSRGIDDLSGQPYISVFYEDVALVEELVRNGKSYPFGNTKFTLIIEPGSPVNLDNLSVG